VADCFGDQDLLDIADRWALLPPISTLNPHTILQILFDLTQGQACQLLCGSGIEAVYSFLDILPDNIELIGNSATTLHILKSPQHFFPLLDELKLTHPKTSFTLPKKTANYLVKSPEGMGGIHIYYLKNDELRKDSQYYQQYIAGEQGSILFLANGSAAQGISINQHHLAPTTLTPFRLGGITSSWILSTEQQTYLELAVNNITAETGLLGLNSLDFILSKHNEIYLLEVNPRPSRSAELIDDPTELLQHHLNACQGFLPSKPLVSATNTSLKIIYASHNLIIPTDMNWPDTCSDLGTVNSFIPKGAPICTSLIRGNIDQSQHSLIESKIVEQLQT